MDEWTVPLTIRVVMGRPLAQVCRTSLNMLGMSWFPGDLPPSSTGRIDWQPSPGQTFSGPMAGYLEPQPNLVLIQAPGVVQRLPDNPGSQGDQGDPIYPRHAFGAKITPEGLCVKQRLDVYIHAYIYINTYIYIYILVSSARFARAMAYGIILRHYIMGLYYGIILRDNTTG